MVYDEHSEYGSDVVEDDSPLRRVWGLVYKLRQRCSLYEEAAKRNLQLVRDYVPDIDDFITCPFCGEISLDNDDLVLEAGIRCNTCDDIICDRCAREKKIFEDNEKICQRCEERILCSCETNCAVCGGDRRPPTPPPKKKKKTKSNK